MQPEAAALEVAKRLRTGRSALPVASTAAARTCALVRRAHPEPELACPAMLLRRYSVDLERNELELELPDGTTLSDRFDAGAMGGDLKARRLSVELDDRELSIITADGLEIRLELGDRGHGDMPPAGRPIVYLDQLHWIALAQQLRAPKKIGAPVRSVVKFIVVGRS